MATMTQHPEWEKENSLSTPDDLNSDPTWRPEQEVPPITGETAKMAITELNQTAFIKKFPRIDRTYADPAISLQSIGLISFTPAKGATPNKSGIYGFAKLRGNYPNEMEASQRSEFLIRNIDSYHRIYHAYVGRPFPITLRTDYSATSSEIDIRTETATSISTDIKNKKLAEQGKINEIKEREKALLLEASQSEADPFELYITLRVKKAQLYWTYLKTLDKVNQMKIFIKNTRASIKKSDEKNPEFKDTYLEKYMKVCDESGINIDLDDESGFIKYLQTDVNLPGIDFVETLESSTGDTTD